MGLLIRIQKKLENKLLHKHGEHGKPVYYADPDEVEETTTPRTSASSSRPTSRLNLSFLSSTRRNSTQAQARSASTDIPPRSPSFFCRGSSSQPNARRSHHARNGSNISSTGGGSRSGTWPGEVGQSFRVPASFPDSGGCISRESDLDIGFLPEGDEVLASPSQLGNSMTLGGEMNHHNHHHQWRGVPTRVSGTASPDGNPNKDFVNGEDSEVTATGGLRGFEGDRDGFFTPLVPVERPVQSARVQNTTAASVPAVVRLVQPPTAAPSSSGDGGRTMRMQIDDARRERRPFTTTRALAGYACTTGEL